MNSGDKKISFLGIIFSQAMIVMLGLMVLLGQNIKWHYWWLGPAMDLPLALLAAFLTYALIYWIYAYGGAFSRQLLVDVQKITIHFKDYSWFNIGCVALLAGVGEELLFRVALQSLLANYVPIYLAIIIPALVFGLLHFLSWSYFISATVMGLIFGVVYFITQSAILVIVWHAVYDLIALGVIIKYPHVLGLAPRVNMNT